MSKASAETVIFNKEKDKIVMRAEADRLAFPSVVVDELEGPDQLKQAAMQKAQELTGLSLKMAGSGNPSGLYLGLGLDNTVGTTYVAEAESEASLEKDCFWVPLQTAVEELEPIATKTHREKVIVRWLGDVITGKSPKPVIGG